MATPEFAGTVEEIPDSEWREIGTIDQLGHARVDWAAATRWRPIHELLWRR
jgi:hypothetical protein